MVSWFPISPKTGIGGARGSILKRVPPNVGLAEQRAADLVPISLGIIEAGTAWPAVLPETGNPSPSPRRACHQPHQPWRQEPPGTDFLLVVDRVGLGGLEVRVCINADPVDRINSGLVGTVHPGGPGVDVTDGRTGERSAGNGIANLLDVSRR